MAETEERRGEPLPVVIDDVDAELDNRTIDHLVRVVGSDRQLILSSAHPEAVAPLVEAQVVGIRAGAVVPGGEVE